MPDDVSSRHAPGVRGRTATQPQDIPPRGWKDVLVRTWRSISENNIFLVSGGVTYAGLLALFPGLAALVSIYGLLMDPAQIEKQVDALSGVLPQETRQMLSGELHQLISASNGKLGVAAVVGLLLAIWSASRGMSGMITAMDIAYEQPERRGFVRFNLTALLLTAAMMVGGLVAIALVAGLPAAVQLLGVGGTLKWLLLLLEWPLLMVFVMVSLAMLYRYAPDRDEPQWRWVSPGAIVATILWVAGSIAFTVYVTNFGSYDKTYGSLGGAVVMLTWLYLSSFVMLLGAVINAQSERQTERDSTVGAPQPMGRRGARAADTVGESADEAPPHR
jgi:membrane protein